MLTKEGLQKLQEEIKELREIRRPEIIDKIEQARELGDLSENAEYHDAKEQQGWLESRIAEIEEIMKRATITDAVVSGGDSIVIGASFTVQDKEGKKKDLTVVGFNEADPGNGRISNESPLGRAFVGKKVGDIVEIEVPKGIIVYKITNIG